MRVSVYITAACWIGLVPLAVTAQQQVEHWSYRQPRRVGVPEVSKSRHPVDTMLLARMQRHGLEPTGTGDRRTLIRRLTLDLIGLPPTPEEVDGFVQDADPKAYERLVDRLLDSPRYGERWAVPWLDLVRYGDTNGYNFDGGRSIWLYRDWVINALNADMPFDEFSVRQLAGDLLPDASVQDRIATGMHRNTMLNNEGGVDPAEARWERLLDRTTTTATIWLGATFQCARCHDHKYDPISQRDFYGMVAFFENDDEVKLEHGGVSTLVLAQRSDPSTPPTTQLRTRGGFVDGGETVAAAVPGLWHDWPAGAPRNRLGLARWLVSADNPLAARAHVNRLWMALFGQPLAATPEDLGLQCEEPMHLDVLDWLATEFVRLGWSQKALLRSIVTTEAYRRSSVAPTASYLADPDNALLARGGRFRLEAEQIRDQALQFGGLLYHSIGGPSVRPLQADTSGAIALNKVNMSWEPSEGVDRHRRGIYTYWRRTAPFVQLAVFDAPSREECVVRRERTNTPLQALVGLNDPALWEAAQGLAERMRQRAGSDRDRLRWGFLLCAGRSPDDLEVEFLDRALAVELAADADRAWILVANVLLNLDEVLTRG
jgi:hypothetical protein